MDGSFLKGMPVELIKQGQYHKLPVIIGTTRDELRIYTMSIPGLGLWSRASVNSLIKLLTGNNAPALMAMYDYKEFRRPIDLAFAFANQMAFDTPAFLMAQAMLGNNPVYWYRFDRDETRMPHKVGAMHGIDVPFVFGALKADTELIKLLASKKTVKKAATLGYTMMRYAANFARTGNPNGEGQPPWPAYTSEKKERLYIDNPITFRPLSEKELERYQWFAARSLEDIMAGKLSKTLKSK